MNGLHVAVLPSQAFRTSASPGTGVFEGDQSRALQRSGARVGLIAVDASRSVMDAIRARALPRIPGTSVGRREGIDLVERRVLPVRYGSPRKRARYWTRAALSAFDRYVDEYGRPDVIHVHFARYGALAAREIRAAHGVPYVVTEHGSAYALGQVDGDEVELLRPAFADAARVVVVSDILGETLRGMGLVDRYDVIPNMVDSRFSELPPPSGSGRFLSIGALRPVKNHRLLIDAFADAFPSGDATLRIVGDGPLRADLTQQIHDLGVSGRVGLGGAVTREGVLREMGRATTLVHAADYETFCVSVVEALAAGRPVVSTDCGGPSLIVAEGDGILVPADDRSTLASAMRDVAGRSFDPDDIRSRARERFSSETVGRRLADLLATATEN